MPTDWSTFKSNVACQVKTKFNGNPRFIAEKYNLKKKSLVQSANSSIIINNEYVEDEETKPLESIVFDDLLSISEPEEIVEQVWLN
jgi:hypothetical protein